MSDIERILNCVPSRDTEKDWGLRHALDSNAAMAAPALPPSVDLRVGWWAIGDQGRTGSCVGWALGDSVLRYLLVRAGRLGPTELLSVRFLWMSAKETDEFIARPSAFLEYEGTSLKAALDVARKFGAVSDVVLPFSSNALYAGDPNTFYALAARLKISSYFSLGTTASAWRQWLASGGPILTRLNVDRTWDAAAASKGSLDTYDSSSRRGGHAVSIVGYTADGRFIVRNSWGTSWGDGGFAYASEAYAHAAFTEAYGVTI